MGIQIQAGVERVRNRIVGNGRGRRILAATGLEQAVAVLSLTSHPEPAHACLLPGIPC